MTMPDFDTYESFKQPSFSAGVDSLLPPIQRFMYRYGCFMSFWSRFELFMEVMIWRLRSDDPFENCQKINPLTAGRKRKVLKDILIKCNRHGIVALIDRVFENAERDHWVHGHILFPDGDFSRLTKLRVLFSKKPDPILSVHNTPIDLAASPFEEFYSAINCLERTADSELGVHAGYDTNWYIKELTQGPIIDYMRTWTRQILRDESREGLKKAEDMRAFLSRLDTGKPSYYGSELVQQSISCVDSLIDELNKKQRPDSAT